MQKIRGKKDQLALLEGAKNVIFSGRENNPRAHMMPSVSCSSVIPLPDVKSHLSAVLRAS